MASGHPNATLLAERYRIGALIGRGGMADVHAGTDERLQRDVAIKVMRPGVGADDVAARFDDEARVAANLQHPNVVAVYDTGTTSEGLPFIVMERLPGETLADRIRAGPMPEAAVRAVADDVLAALATAHAAGVVHRDIKPGNILLTDDGRAKVADFGIARESDSLLVDPTTANALTGTPAYLAPERIDGKPATARSDIWSVGVVLYEAVAGAKPFDGPSPLAVAMAVRDNQRESLPAAAPGVDPAFASVVERALSPSPEARFATAAEMAAAFRGEASSNGTADATAVIDRTQLLTVPPPVPAGPAPRARVAPVWWWAAAAVVAVLVLVAVGVAVGRSGSPRNANPASVQQQSTTVAPPTTVASTTSIVVTTLPVQNAPVQAPVEVRPRHGKRGKG